MCHAILIHQSWTKVLGTALQYSYFAVISRCPHKTVHPFWNFLAVLPLPTLYKVETPKIIMDAHVQHCLWDEGRGWTRVNWKMTQKCNVSQDFCPAGLYFKCFRKKRFTNSSCCSVIDKGSMKHHQFFFRNYYGCEIAGFSIPAAEHRCTF